jgi:ABC-type multidrug transport system permease subunit
LFLFLTGSTFLFISSGLIPYTIIQLWPLIVFFCGVSLLVSGFYRQQRMRISHLVPSIVLILLGILFLLFSLHVFTARFSVIVAQWWPVALIAAGIALVLLYLSRSAAATALSTLILDDEDNIEDNSE